MKQEKPSSNPHDLAIAKTADYLTRFVAAVEPHSAYLDYLVEQYPELDLNLNGINLQNTEEINKINNLFKAFAREKLKEEAPLAVSTDEFNALMLTLYSEYDEIILLLYEDNLYNCKKDIKDLNNLLKKVEKTYAANKKNSKMLSLIHTIKKGIKKQEEQLVIIKLQIAKSKISLETKFIHP